MLGQSSSDTDGRISLRLAGQGFFATQLLGFLPEATDGYDDAFDGAFINEGANIEFYSLLAGQKYSIQAFSELITTDKTVDLGYEVINPGTYTISIDAEFINPNFDIILEDATLGTFTDLRLLNYAFDVVTAAEENNRFYLHFNYLTPLTIDDNLKKKTTLSTYFTNDVLHIQTQETSFTNVKLFDISGKKVVDTIYDDTISTKGLSKGIYILQLEDNTGKLITKKIIK